MKGEKVRGTDGKEGGTGRGRGEMGEKRNCRNGNEEGWRGKGREKKRERGGRERGRKRGNCYGRVKLS